MAKIPFFATLPKATIAEIKRRAKRHGESQAVIVEDAISNTTPRSDDAQKRAKQYAKSPNFSQMHSDLISRGPRKRWK